MPGIILGPGVRVHRTLQTLFLGLDPVRILEYDPRRVWASIVSGFESQTNAAIGATEQQCRDGDSPTTLGLVPYEVYGPGELWAWGNSAGSSPGNVIVQTLRYED